LGDNNTKFFHSFSNHRRNINTIWELQDHGGTKVRGFKGLAELGVKHFEGIYKEPKRENLAEILKVISYFPRMINEELNEDLYILVTKEELFSILQYFKKDKSPGPDGWLVEFYIEFFDSLWIC
jgi:hypothetical protein